MIKSDTPRVSGFNIELLDPTFILNVQDVNGNLIAGADILVEYSEGVFTGNTDAEGSCAIMAAPSEICTLTISNDCYRSLVQRFIAIPIDTTKNFVIKVVDASDDPVVGASVTISSNEPITINGTTDNNGIFEALLDTHYTNTINIQKSGLQTITYSYNPFNAISSFNESYRVVPVITME